MKKHILTPQGLNAFTGRGCGYWASRVECAKIAEHLKTERMLCKPTLSDRYHIYTTSQLIELFAKRGDITVRIANREPIAIKAGDQSVINVLFSTIGRDEVFKIVINTMSGPNKNSVGDGYDITMNMNVCEFIKLSANSIKSKSNLGPLFEVWNVPLFSSQRRSLGLDLK